jgi:hypothetical protein
MKLLRSPPAHQPLQPAREKAIQRKNHLRDLHDYASEVLVQKRLLVFDDVAMLQLTHYVNLFLGSLVRKSEEVWVDMGARPTASMGRRLTTHLHNQ